jgi:hypothetical protein
MKIQALVTCDEFLCTCITNLPLVYWSNRLLHVFIATHARVAQKRLQVCEEVKITWSQVRTVGSMGGGEATRQSQQIAHVCQRSLLAGRTSAQTGIQRKDWTCRDNSLCYVKARLVLWSELLKNINNSQTSLRRYGGVPRALFSHLCAVLLQLSLVRWRFCVT